MNHNEKRAYLRISIDSEMRYRLVDSLEFYSAQCSSLSGAGIAFITTQRCDEGKAMEVYIKAPNTITPAFTAFVEVVRVTELANGECEIATIIKTIKG
ncbi:MAG: PilZ domain-containing protein [Methylococcaceae bacterium]